jgi:hypothetical protein
MKKSFFFLILSIGFIFISSCTKNQKTKHWGGTEEYTLPKGHRFVNATWKDADLWVLSQDTVTKDFYFREKSEYGILEGTVVFKQEK